jgi:hypothetical protein
MLWGEGVYITYSQLILNVITFTHPFTTSTKNWAP